MDIYSALKKDHEELKSLLAELVTLKIDDDYRFILIEEIRSLLIPHSRAEESVFYNTLRAVEADKKIVMHAFQEHLEAEALLRTLQVMDKMNADWKATANKLKEAIEHHIDEEESEVFEEARAAFSKEEAVAMAEAFEQLKPEIQKGGFMKNTMEIMVNLMPPRLADKIRHIGENFTERHH